MFKTVLTAAKEFLFWLRCCEKCECGKRPPMVKPRNGMFSCFDCWNKISTSKGWHSIKLHSMLLKQNSTKALYQYECLHWGDMTDNWVKSTQSIHIWWCHPIHQVLVRFCTQLYLCFDQNCWYHPPLFLRHFSALWQGAFLFDNYSEKFWSTSVGPSCADMKYCFLAGGPEQAGIELTLSQRRGQSRGRERHITDRPVVTLPTFMHPPPRIHTHTHTCSCSLSLLHFNVSRRFSWTVQLAIHFKRLNG